jgi:NADH-quinone oxidoreductase subunit N
VLTITIGNLFAIRQDNIKRFLAFSSIAQVGYVLLVYHPVTVQASALPFIF